MHRETRTSSVEQDTAREARPPKSGTPPDGQRIRSRYPQIPVDEAVAAVLARVKPLSSEVVTLSAAAGRILAENVVATEPLPPFAASAKDGFAVVADDAPGPRRIVGEVVAGGTPTFRVGPGEVARITTGAPLPPGADAVVMIEHTIVRGQTVEVEQAVASGADVRPAGTDYAEGDSILPSGTLLGPAELGLLASTGRVEVPVVRRPRVVILSTGDELVPPEASPAAGQIRDSNSTALSAAAEAAGATVTRRGLLSDTPDSVAGLTEALSDGDVLITSGGVSMGHLDLVKPWLETHGTVVFGRVRARPGKPVTFAMVDGKPVFALPGFPVSAMVGFELFARPALLAMAGHSAVQRPVWTVRLAEPTDHAADRVDFQRAVVRLGPNGPVARTTGPQGSGRLLSFRDANALLRLEPGDGPLPAGASVSALILGPVFAEAGP